MTPPSPPSLTRLRFGLVGPGRVGSSLAAWLVARGARLGPVAGRTEDAARALAGALGGVAVPLGELASASEDLLLIAVPDPAIAPLATRLAAHPQASVVLHTSGRHDAAVLAPLAGSGRALGSFHPLKAFPRPLPDVAEAARVFFATDGDAPAQALARRLGVALGGEVGEVPAESRAIYHLAASLAAGGVTTLLALAAEMADEQGLSPAVGRSYLALARGALASAAEAPDFASAITGPVARGDFATFREEVAALAASGSGLVDLIERLARETARLAGRALLDPPRGGC